MQTAHDFIATPAARRTASPATPDALLVQRAAQGDESAFECIMRRHNRLLFRTARSILKIDAEAEDALQEAYLRAWRALPTFRADAKVSTWLVRIVINEALARVRRSTGQLVAIDGATEAAHRELHEALEDNPDDRPEPHAMRAQLRQLMERRIDRLPESLRTVFVLRAVEELTVEEVSLALDLSEATVRTRLFRARSLLREGLSSAIDVAIGDAFEFGGTHCDRIVAGVLGKLGQGPKTGQS